MSRPFALVAIAVLFPGAGFACSFDMSPEFRFRSVTHAPPAPVRLNVETVTFVPWIHHGGSCDGAGFIAITFSGVPVRNLRNTGFFVRAVSGVNDETLFPSYPLAATGDNGSRTIVWAWTGITPDSDGHVRWQLEITPVSRSRATSEPVVVCVSSDGSCPDPSDSGTGSQMGHTIENERDQGIGQIELPRFGQGEPAHLLMLGVA